LIKSLASFAPHTKRKRNSVPIPRVTQCRWSCRSLNCGF
jgi:hypothetical protein